MDDHHHPSSQSSTSTGPSGPSRRGCPSEVPCPHPWPWPADTWLAAPLTSPNLSKANPWIQLRLQLGPATSRRHLTGNKCSEMSPTPALCQSGSTPWRPLLSRDCSPQVSCSHDFHCPVCACACTCVPAPACPLAQTPPLSCMHTLTTLGVLPALKKYSSRGLRPRGEPRLHPAHSLPLTSRTMCLHRSLC